MRERDKVITKPSSSTSRGQGAPLAFFYSSTTLLQQPSGSLSVLIRDFLWQRKIVRSLDVVSHAIGRACEHGLERRSDPKEYVVGSLPELSEIDAVLCAIGLQDLARDLAEKLLEEHQAGTLRNYLPGAIAALAMASQSDVQIGVINMDPGDHVDLARFFDFFPQPLVILNDEAQTVRGDGSCWADELARSLSQIDTHLWFFGPATESSFLEAKEAGFRVASVGSSVDDRGVDIAAERVDQATRAALDREGLGH